MTTQTNLGPDYENMEDPENPDDLTTAERDALRHARAGLDTSYLGAELESAQRKINEARKRQES